MKYTHLNLLDTKKQTLEEILEDHPYLDLKYKQPNFLIDFFFHNKQPLRQKCHFMICPI